MVLLIQHTEIMVVVVFVCGWPNNNSLVLCSINFCCAWLSKTAISLSLSQNQCKQLIQNLAIQVHWYKNHALRVVPCLVMEVPSGLVVSKFGI